MNTTFKRIIFASGIFQLGLLLSILITSFFVVYGWVWHSDSSVTYISFFDESSIIALSFQLIGYIAFTVRNVQLFKGKIKNIKSFGISSVIFYFLLIVLYIIVWSNHGTYWIGTVTYSWHDFTNEAGKIMATFWIFSLFYFLFPLSTNLVLAIKSPKYLSEKQSAAKMIKNREESIEKLRVLKKLFDDGIISKETFDEKKKKYTELL